MPMAAHEHVASACHTCMNDSESWVCQSLFFWSCIAYSAVSCRPGLMITAHHKVMCAEDGTKVRRWKEKSVPSKNERPCTQDQPGLAAVEHCSWGSVIHLAVGLEWGLHNRYLVTIAILLAFFSCLLLCHPNKAHLCRSHIHVLQCSFHFDTSTFIIFVHMIGCFALLYAKSQTGSKGSARCVWSPISCLEAVQSTVMMDDFVHNSDCFIWGCESLDWTWVRSFTVSCRIAAKQLSTAPSTSAHAVSALCCEVLTDQSNTQNVCSQHCRALQHQQRNKLSEQGSQSTQ